MNKTVLTVQNYTDHFKYETKVKERMKKKRVLFTDLRLNLAIICIFIFLGIIQLGCSY